jgi:hypothetical protein
MDPALDVNENSLEELQRRFCDQSEKPLQTPQ